MKIKVLANDGISQAGIDLLSQNNYEVITDNVEQEKLIDYINEYNISCLLVRSATKVRKDIIDSCKELIEKQKTFYFRLQLASKEDPEAADMKERITALTQAFGFKDLNECMDQMITTLEQAAKKELDNT